MEWIDVFFRVMLLGIEDRSLQIIDLIAVGSARIIMRGKFFLPHLLLVRSGCSGYGLAVGAAG